MDDSSLLISNLEFLTLPLDVACAFPEFEFAQVLVLTEHAKEAAKSAS